MLASAGPIYEDDFSLEVERAFESFSSKGGLFRIEDASQEGIDEDVIQVAEIYNDMMRSREAERSGMGTRAADPSMWNWCGSRNTKDDPTFPALNSIDSACKDHDLCLRGGEVGQCQCDSYFIQRLKQLRSDYSPGLERGYIEAAIQAVPWFHGCKW